MGWPPNTGSVGSTKDPGITARAELRSGLATSIGFEPTISALTGRVANPLSECRHERSKPLRCGSRGIVWAEVPASPPGKPRGGQADEVEEVEASYSVRSTLKTCTRWLYASIT